MMDSGSFCTITPSKCDFETYHALEVPMHVKAFGGSLLKVSGKGMIRLKSNVVGNTEDLLINEVLHVPSADGRLISVATLDDDMFDVLFSRGTCTVFNRDHKAILQLGKDLKSRQYRLVENFDGNKTDISTLAVDYAKRKCTLMELHHEMGHAHPVVLKKMIINGKLPHLELVDPENQFECLDCIKGKSTKVIHAQKASRPGNYVGHIVSADLIDLRDTPSIGNFKFVSVLVDHYSYYSSVKPIKEKTAEEVVNHVKEFNAQIRSVTGKDITIFRSDAGNEYRNSQLSSFARDRGIRIEIGAPHEPRDNGFAERRNRTLTDAARTVLISSKLPLSLWPNAYEYVCYSQNYTGRRQFSFASPSSRFFGTVPEKCEMHAFGQSCFVQNTALNTPKLSNRSDSAIFVGYCDNSVAYKVFMNNHVKIAQHVIFPRQDVVYETDTTHVDVPALCLPVPIESSDESVPIPVESIVSNPLPHTLVDAYDPVVSQSVFVPPATVFAPRHSARSSNQDTLNKISSAVGSNRRVLGVNEIDVINEVDIELTPLEEIDPDVFPSESIGFGASTRGPLARHWTVERTKELNNWINLDVVEIADLPEGTTPIPAHWIHTVKRNADGKIVRLKARCVADGNHQIYGENYTETYASTPAPEIARLLLTIAAANDWEVHQMDVDCAYLNASLPEPVFMKIPKGVDIDHQPGQVLKVKKALYGLKQAGHEWALHLKEILEKIGWEQSPRDPCIFSMANEQFLLVYVDDLLLITPSQKAMIRRKEEIGNCLNIKDLGEVHDYLGINIKRHRNEKVFLMRQIGLIDEIIEIMKPDHHQNIPMNPQIDMAQTSTNLNPTEHNKYRSVLGKMLYVARITRPDIAVAVNILGRYVSSPTHEHLLTMRKLSGYLLGSRELYLKLDGNEGTHLTGMSDADWAGDVKDRKSTTGYVCFMGNSPIIWSSTKQKCVAGSTMHAEYVALSDASKEMLYLLNLASSITEISVPAIMYCDNTAAQTIAEGKSGPVTKGAKHIDIRYHIVKEIVTSGKIQLKRIESSMNTADIFTKPLPVDSFNRHLKSLNLTTE